MNRYYGNTGRYEHFPEPDFAPPQRNTQKPPQPRSGRGGGMALDLSGILNRLSLRNLEQEDLLLILIVYLLYRESGDRELLITLGALLFL